MLFRSFQFGAATALNFTTTQTGVTIEDGATVTTTASAGGVFTLGTNGQTFTSSGTAAVTVTGGTGADNITVGSTGGSTITASNGIDTITLTNSTGVDRVGVSAAVANRDVVTGFSATNDIIVLSAAATTAATAAAATPVVQAVNAAANTVLNNAADVTVFNFDQGGTTSVLAGVLDGAALIANTGTFTVGAANNVGYIVAYDNSNAFVYAYNAGADTNVTADEILLIGTFNGLATAALGVANFALIA